MSDPSKNARDDQIMNKIAALLTGTFIGIAMFSLPARADEASVSDTEVIIDQRAKDLCETGGVVTDCNHEIEQKDFHEGYENPKTKTYPNPNVHRPYTEPKPRVSTKDRITCDGAGFLEGMCNNYLATDRIKNAQDFRAIQDSCSDKYRDMDAIQSCVEDYTRFDYKDKGAPLTKKKTKVLGIDSLMSGTKPAPAPQPAKPVADAGQQSDPKKRTILSIDSTLAGSQGNVPAATQSDPRAPSLAFDNILAGRLAVRRDKALSDLEAIDAQMTEKCRCLGAADGCYEFDYAVHRLSEDAVIEAVSQNFKPLNDQHRQICNAWADNYRISDTMTEQNFIATKELGERFVASFGKIQGVFDNIMQKAREQELATQRAREQQLRAQQEAERKARNAQLFKIGAALAGSAIAGANLPTDQAVRFSRAWTADIMSGTTSNMQQLNQELNAELAVMRQQREFLENQEIAQMRANEERRNQELLAASAQARTTQPNFNLNLNPGAGTTQQTAPSGLMPGLSIQSRPVATSSQVAIATQPQGVQPGSLTGGYWRDVGPRFTDTTFGGETIGYRKHNTLKFFADGTGSAYLRSVYEDGDIINESIRSFSWEIQGDTVLVDGNPLSYSGSSLGNFKRDSKGPAGSMGSSW